MRKTLSLLAVIAILNIANMAHGQSSGAWPNPIIGYTSRLACQEQESKMETSVESLAICLKVCEGSAEDYTVRGRDSSTFQWSVTGGAFQGGATGTSVTVVWGTSGSGMLAVTETTSDSLVRTAYLCIDLVASPEALFTILPEVGSSYCTKQDIAFWDQSTIDDGNIIAWLWDFGDGSYSSEPNPVHQWGDAGTSTVSLTVYNECNCSSTYSLDVNITEGTRIAVTCPGVVCQNHIATYTANGECPEYAWTVLGGTILEENGNEVVVRWDDAASLTDGFGSVSLKTGLCPESCSEYTTVKVPVVTDTASISGERMICAGHQYQYSLPEWPATVFEWEVSDTAVAALLYPPKGKDVYLDAKQAGTITLKARYRNTLTGCSGMASMNVTVRAATRIVSSDWDDGPVCQNSTLTFQWKRGNVSLSGLWRLQQPDGTTLQYSGAQFTHTYALAGLYTLSVSAGAYCSPDDVHVVVTDRPAMVDTIAGARAVCLNTSYTYTADTSLTGTEYAWSAVNGTILRRDGNTATIKWSAFPAQLVVRRRMTAPPFCYSDSMTVDITSLMNASFHIEMYGSGQDHPSCRRDYRLMMGDEVFLNASNYEWKLSNDSIASLENNYSARTAVLAHDVSTTRYPQLINNFTVCNVLLTDTLQLTITPVPLPVIVGVDTVCPQEATTFSAQNGSEYEYFLWSWDSYTATGAAPSITFVNGTGADRVVLLTLKATTSCGSTVRTTKYVLVRAAPCASINCSSNVLTVTSSTECDYQWLFNGTPLGTGNTITMDGNAGVYECIVTDAAMPCVTVLYYKDTIIPPQPECVNFIVSTVRCGQFDVTATPEDFDKYVWKCGPRVTLLDGQYTPMISCEATVAGQHTVSVTVGDLSGDCGGIYYVNVIVPLVANLAAVYSCDNDNAQQLVVNDCSSSYPADATRGATLYQLINGAWTAIQPGVPIASVTPGATYQFRIDTWIAGTSYFCSKEISYTVPQMPDATFSAVETDACVNVPIQLTPANTHYSYYYWELGDNATTTLTTLPRTFSFSGQRTISLHVQDEYGCASSSSVLVDVYDNTLRGEIAYDTAAVCFGNSVTLSFYNTMPTSPDTYLWSPGSATTSSIIVTTPTRYTLTIADRHHCQYRMGPDGAKIIVPVTPLIIGDKDICLGDNTTLYGLCGGDSVTAYRWYRLPDTTTVIGAGSQLPLTASAVGSFSYRLSATYLSGCEAHGEYTFTVHALPPVPRVSMTNLSCEPYQFRLNATDDSAGGSYVWSNGGGGNSIVVGHGGAYNVTYVDRYGCKATSGNLHVPLSPDSYAWTFPTGCYEFCPEELPRYVYGPVEFPASGTWSWEWYRDGTLQAAGSGESYNAYGLEPPLTIDTAGSYSMELSNGYCGALFGDAVVTLRDTAECASCLFSLEDIYFCLLPDGTVRATLTMDNASGVDLNYLVTAMSPTGTYYNAQGVMQQGIQSYTHIFYPDSPVGIGQLLNGYISAWYPAPLNFHCQQLFDNPVSADCEEGDGGVSYSLPGLRDSLSLSSEMPFRLYPNPTTDGVWVVYEAGPDDHCQLKIRNVLGQELIATAVAADGSPLYLSLKHLSAGAYMIEYCKNGQVMAVQKLIKK